MDYSFWPVPTVNPREFALAVAVSHKSMENVRMPQVGDTYMQCQLPAQVNAIEYHSYKFTHFETGPEPGYNTFYFVRPKNAEERLTPFRTTPSKQEFTWPPIVLSVDISRDPTLREAWTQTQFYSTWSVAKMYSRVEWVPALSGEWDCEVEEYLSDTPYTHEELSTRKYVLAPIEFEYPGLPKQTLPPSIHDDIFIPGYQEPVFFSTTESFDVPQPGIVIPDRTHPATRLTTWIKHAMSDTQVPREGQYYRKRIVIKPPPLPEPTVSY